MWPIYLLGLTWTIPHQPIQAYITLILRGLHFNVVQTNLLTVPAYSLFVLQLIFWTWVSEKINNRFLIVFFCQFWCLPLVIALELLPASASPWSRYALSVLLIGFPYVHAIIGSLPFTIGNMEVHLLMVLPSCHHQSKCGLRQNKNCGLSSVQHVCPDQQHYLLKCTASFLHTIVAISAI
jgi:hypothetical protein